MSVVRFYRLVHLKNSPGPSSPILPHYCAHARQLRPQAVAEQNLWESRYHTRGRFVACNADMIVTLAELKSMLCDGCHWWRDDCRCESD